MASYFREVEHHHFGWVTTASAFLYSLNQKISISFRLLGSCWLRLQDFTAVAVRGESMRRKGLMRKTKYFYRKDLIQEICYIEIRGLEKWNTGIIIIGSSYHVLGEISRPKNSEEKLWRVSAQTSKERSLPRFWSYLWGSRIVLVLHVQIGVGSWSHISLLRWCCTRSRNQVDHWLWLPLSVSLKCQLLAEPNRPRVLWTVVCRNPATASQMRVEKEKWMGAEIL